MTLFLLAAALAVLQQRPAGHLFVVGGGSQADSLVVRFVELAGGRGRARIAVVPMASSEPAATGEAKAVQLREFGADAFVLLLTRAQADSASTARRLDGVTGIGFTGGDQTLVTPRAGREPRRSPR